MTEPDVFRGVSNRKSRVRMWWCIVMLVTGVAAVGSVLFIGYGRSQGQRIQCVANLFSLGYGMRVYQDKYGHLPPAHVDGSDGRRMHSWRILVTEHVTLPVPYPYDFNEAFGQRHRGIRVDNSALNCMVSRCRQLRGGPWSALPQTVPLNSLKNR